MSSRSVVLAPGGRSVLDHEHAKAQSGRVFGFVQTPAEAADRVNGLIEGLWVLAALAGDAIKR